MSQPEVILDGEADAARPFGGFCESCGYEPRPGADPQANRFRWSPVWRMWLCMEHDEGDDE